MIDTSSPAMACLVVLGMPLLIIFGATISNVVNDNNNHTDPAVGVPYKYEYYDHLTCYEGEQLTHDYYVYDFHERPAGSDNAPMYRFDIKTVDRFDRKVSETSVVIMLQDSMHCHIVNGSAFNPSYKLLVEK